MPAQVTCPHCSYSAYLSSEETEAGVICPRCYKSIKLGAATAIRRQTKQTSAERQCPACGTFLDKVLRICPFCDHELGLDVSEQIMAADHELGPRSSEQIMAADKTTPTAAPEQDTRDFYLALLGAFGFGLVYMLCVLAGFGAIRSDLAAILVVAGIALFCLLVHLAVVYRIEGKQTGLVVKIIYHILVCVGLYVVIAGAVVVVMIVLLLLLIAFTGGRGF